MRISGTEPSSEILSQTCIKIVAAFRGMHVSPAKHSSAGVTDGQTDRQTDGRTTDKVILMCRYASQATQKLKSNNQKVPKQAEAKRDGVINPQNYNFNQF